MPPTPTDVRTVALDWPPDALDAASVAIARAAMDRHLSEQAWALIVKDASHVFSRAVAAAKASGLDVEYAPDPKTGGVSVTRVSRLVWPRDTAAP